MTAKRPTRLIDTPLSLCVVSPHAFGSVSPKRCRAEPSTVERLLLRWRASTSVALQLDHALLVAAKNGPPGIGRAVQHTSLTLGQRVSLGRAVRDHEGRRDRTRVR